MKRETYKDRKIKVVKGRDADWGYTRVTLNGVDMGKWMGDEDAALRSIRGTIDHADEVGVSSGRYGADWYAPGTYELCEHDHAKPIGGECGHHYCAEQRAEAAPVVDEPAYEAVYPVDGTESTLTVTDDEVRGHCAAHGHIITVKISEYAQPGGHVERTLRLHHVEEHGDATNEPAEVVETDAPSASCPVLAEPGNMHFMGRCDVCDAHRLAKMSPDKVEQWYHSGHFGQAKYEAYMHAWATSAPRYTASGWVAEPTDPEVVRLVALIRRAAGIKPPVSLVA